MSFLAMDFVTQYNRTLALLGVTMYSLSQNIIQACKPSGQCKPSKIGQVQNSKSIKHLSSGSASSRSALRNDLNVFRTHLMDNSNKAHLSRVPCSESKPKQINPVNSNTDRRQKPKVSILQRQLDKQNITPLKQYASIIQQINISRPNKFRPTVMSSQRSSLSQSMYRSRLDSTGNKNKHLASRQNHNTKSNRKKSEIASKNTQAEQKSFYLQRFKCKIQDEIQHINQVLNNLNRGCQTSRSSKTIHVNLSNVSITPLKGRKGLKVKPLQGNFYQQECQRVSIQSRSLERSFVSLTNRTQAKPGGKILKETMTFYDIKRRPLLTTKIAKAS